MNKNRNANAISRLLVDWYEKNKRDLPWRDTNDPYIIWISEIILQQTRVVQGYDYFCRFIQKYPDVYSLAKANEEDVLKLWQGLGYYSRARNLHSAAKDVVTRFNGKFPERYEDVLSLKGIGEYTAAAIASFSYNQPYAVVDGNVFRVLSRLFAVETPIDTPKAKKVFGQIAFEILDKNNPGIHNQAIMELGALQCTPLNPECNNCPLVNCCAAYSADTVMNYPVKSGKTVQKNRYFNYLDIRSGDYIYIRKRVENDVWKNLYEFPLIETDSNLSMEQLLSDERFAVLFSDREIVVKFQIKYKHVLSHRIINASFYKVELEQELKNDGDFIKIPIDEIAKYPTSRLVHKYIEKFIE